MCYQLMHINNNQTAGCYSFTLRTRIHHSLIPQERDSDLTFVRETEGIKKPVSCRRQH